MARRQHKVSDTIRAAVDASSRTRYRIALDAKVDHASLSRFMNGSGLSADGIDKLADALGLRLVARRPAKRKGTKKGKPKGRRGNAPK